jgi:hypothetical protein
MRGVEVPENMYAAALSVKDSVVPGIPPAHNVDEALPYCFILDDAYRVVMAGPSGGEDPLAPLYAADSKIDELPSPIDRVVRALTATWRTSRPMASVAAMVSHLKVTVAPLHGHDGRRIAVFVQRHQTP